MSSTKINIIDKEKKKRNYHFLENWLWEKISQKINAIDFQIFSAPGIGWMSSTYPWIYLQRTGFIARISVHRLLLISTRCWAQKKILVMLKRVLV
jgi:hypothetical protein